LLRWIVQEGPPGTQTPVHNLSKDPKRLLQQIQDALEQWIQQTDQSQQHQQQQQPQNAAKVTELQQQVQVYQDELKSREESSAELRESLKEAVALLKPLQDAVAKAEEEKQDLQDQLEHLERQRLGESKVTQQEITKQTREISSLQEQVISLEHQIEEDRQLATARQSLLQASLKSANANASPGTPRNANTSADGNDTSLTKIQRAREELRRKRDTEGNLQKLLKDAQTRFHSLHEQNESVAARNRELQGKLKNAEAQLGGGDDEQPHILSSEDQLLQLQSQLQQREQQVQSLQQALQNNSNNGGQDNTKHRQAQLQLDQQLNAAKAELAHKEQAEKRLNKSLKDALGLLKPLQMHLEEAEQEKLGISKELRNLRKRFRQLQMGEMNDDNQSRSTYGGGQDVSIELVKIKEELEETVRQLELENSQLHDALEDLSDNEGGAGGAGGGGGGITPQEAKLRQRFVELNSRYEVTQNKLEDAHVENHALVKALKQKELEEQQHDHELKRMRDQLNKTESELYNAKAIARSALVKVEELTMSNIEQLSISREESIDMSTNFHAVGSN
jgi:chromosome segregation ATPase